MPAPLERGRGRHTHLPFNPPWPLATTLQIPAGATERVFKQVGGAELKLYVFKPTDLKPSERRPAAIYFAGGGWTNLRVETGFPLASRVASMGMVGVSATYRVRSMHNSTPYDSVADAKSAIRWVREHATELQIDPARIVGVGDSAGAHVLLTAALLDTFDEPSETSPCAQPAAHGHLSRQDGSACAIHGGR